MESQKLSKKPLFNLSKVLQETGIKADTLRAWERRYELPTPSRTEGGHRLFSAYDIETIKWLIARQNEGMRISQAVDYWRELLAAGIDPLAAQTQSSAAEPVTVVVDSYHQPLSTLTRLWIDHALDYDEENAGHVLDAAFARFPWEVVCTKLIYQGLAEIGERWYRGDISVQQEHFASELVVRKLNALTAAAPPPYHPQKVLISCPPGEFHTIASLMINTLLRYRGWEVTYLGANVPDRQLEDALDRIQPSLVIMTAARLATGAALLESQKLLHDRGIPFAFGGNVFHIMPDLAEKVPGVYLGPDLGSAISKIENILSAPEPPLIEVDDSNPYMDLKNEFKDNLPLLENQLLLSITTENSSDFIPGIIQDANDFLFQDILAAMAFGDLNLLQSNINWVEGLIKTRDYNSEDFKGYLQSFIEVAEKNLGSKAEPLLDWLRSYLEGLG